MRVLLIALLAAISYAQTEVKVGLTCQCDSYLKGNDDKYIPCIFPFTVESVTYHTCTRFQHSDFIENGKRAWCAVEVSGGLLTRAAFCNVDTCRKVGEPSSEPGPSSSELRPSSNEAGPSPISRKTSFSSILSHEDGTTVQMADNECKPMASTRINSVQMNIEQATEKNRQKSERPFRQIAMMDHAEVPPHTQSNTLKNMGVSQNRMPTPPQRISVPVPPPVLASSPVVSSSSSLASPPGTPPAGVLRKSPEQTLQKNREGGLIVPLSDIEGALPIDLPPPARPVHPPDPSQSTRFLQWRWRPGLRIPGSSSPQTMPREHAYVEQFTMGQPVEVRRSNGNWEMAHIVDLRYGARLATVEFFNDEVQEEVSVDRGSIRPGAVPRYYKGKEVEVWNEETKEWESGIVEKIEGDSITVRLFKNDDLKSFNSGSSNFRPTAETIHGFASVKEERLSSSRILVDSSTFAFRALILAFFIICFIYINIPSHTSDFDYSMYTDEF